jgi:hypothetical protein
MQPIKNGIMTSEFWLHLGVELAIAALTYFVAHASGLPPLLGGVVSAVGPLAMAWLQSQYGEDRTTLKVAALNATAAGATAQAPGAAAKVL